MLRDVVFLFLTYLAEVIGTLGGFGSSVFFVPIANFYFDFHTVLGLTAVFHVFSNISKITLFRKGLNKHLLLLIGLPSVIFVIIGAELTQYFKSYWLEVSLGVFLILLSLFFLIHYTYVIPTTKRTSILGGILSGFSAGFLGTGGAIRGITMAAFNLEKSAFIATSAFIDFAVDFSRAIVYYINDFIAPKHFYYIPFLLAIGIAGTYTGKRLLYFIPQDKFRRISLLLILLVGVVTLIGTYQKAE